MAAKTVWEIWEEKQQQKQEKQQKQREHAKQFVIGLLYLYADISSTPKIYRLLQHLNVDEVIITDLLHEANRCKLATKEALKKAGIKTLLINSKETKI